VDADVRKFYREFPSVVEGIIRDTCLKHVV